MAQKVQHCSEYYIVAHKGAAWLTRAQCVSKGNALAYCKAGTSYNLASAPHEGYANWTDSCKDMEKGLIECL